MPLASIIVEAKLTVHLQAMCCIIDRLDGRCAMDQLLFLLFFFFLFFSWPNVNQAQSVNYMWIYSILLTELDGLWAMDKFGLWTYGPLSYLSCYRKKYTEGPSTCHRDKKRP
jgi:hypothetical protein